MLARHSHQQERVGVVDLLETDAGAIAPRLVAGGLMCAAAYFLIGADRLENALAIFPDEYTGTERPEFCLLFMHPHAPATAVECDCSGQASEPSSGDFGMHQWARRRGMAPRGSLPRLRQAITEPAHFCPAGENALHTLSSRLCDCLFFIDKFGMGRQAKHQLGPQG